MWNKENSYKLKQEVFLDQSCLHLAKWSIDRASYNRMESDTTKHRSQLKNDNIQKISEFWVIFLIYCNLEMELAGKPMKR